MSVTPQVVESLHEVMDARAAGLAEHDLLACVDGADSLAAAIAFADDITQERKRELLGYVRRLVEINQAEGEHERNAARLLDDLARSMHHDECAGLSRALGVLALARHLRPHLAVIHEPHAHDGVAFFKACAAVRDVTRTIPLSRLHAASLRKQLGPNRHDLLMSITEMGVADVA